MEKPSRSVASGTTRRIREQLRFHDDLQWKRFSSRRLELIDRFGLSHHKASEQDASVRSIADTLRHEFGYPVTCLSEFEKLVTAAIQSVRRNRKRSRKSVSDPAAGAAVASAEASAPAPGSDTEPGAIKQDSHRASPSAMGPALVGHTALITHPIIPVSLGPAGLVGAPPHANQQQQAGDGARSLGVRLWHALEGAEPPLSSLTDELRKSTIVRDVLHSQAPDWTLAHLGHMALQVCVTQAAILELSQLQLLDFWCSQMGIRTLCLALYVRLCHDEDNTDDISTMVLIALGALYKDLGVAPAVAALQFFVNETLAQEPVLALRKTSMASVSHTHQSSTPLPVTMSQVTLPPRTALPPLVPRDAGTLRGPAAPTILFSRLAGGYPAQ